LFLKKSDFMSSFFKLQFYKKRLKIVATARPVGGRPKRENISTR